MRDIEASLRIELRDPEYSESYAESFLNAVIATQIKVIREQRNMTQGELGEKVGTTQGGISRLENVDYSSWSVRTLTKIAKAFSVRLKVTFEPFGTLPDEVITFGRSNLERVRREEDPGLKSEAKLDARTESILERIHIAQKPNVDIMEYRNCFNGSGQAIQQEQPVQKEFAGAIALCR